MVEVQIQEYEADLSGQLLSVRLFPRNLNSVFYYGGGARERTSA